LKWAASDLRIRLELREVAVANSRAPWESGPGFRQFQSLRCHHELPGTASSHSKCLVRAAVGAGTVADIVSPLRWCGTKSRRACACSESGAVRTTGNSHHPGYDPTQLLDPADSVGPDQHHPPGGPRQ